MTTFQELATEAQGVRETADALQLETRYAPAWTRQRTCWTTSASEST